MSRKNIKGSALILVLLVVGIVTAVGVSAVDRLHFDIKRSTDFSLRHQAYWFALGLESKVSDFLRERQQMRLSSTVLIPDQDMPSIIVQIEGGNIEGTLSDLRTCFNLNSLVRYNSDNKRVANQAGIDQYRNLLKEIGLDEMSQDQLVFTLIDWTDSNDFLEDINGAEDDYYTRLNYPYRTPNQSISNLSELNNIKNYSSEVLELLRPFLCVLPDIGSNEINVNAIPTSKPEILVMLLGDRVTRNAAANILKDRPITGFADTLEFLSHPELDQLQFSGVVMDQIKTKSDYYLLTTQVRSYDYPFMMKSLLRIIDSGKVEVLTREQGIF